MPICRKTTTKKRKVFDSSKQRAEGSEQFLFYKSKVRGRCIFRTLPSIFELLCQVGSKELGSFVELFQL